MADTFLGQVVDEPVALETIMIVLHCPDDGLSVREICVLAKEEYNEDKTSLRLIRSRRKSSMPFENSVVLPEKLRDGTIIILEIDPTDRDWRPHKVWGIGCLSASREHQRNYNESGDNRLSLREMFLHKVP